MSAQVVYIPGCVPLGVITIQGVYLAGGRGCTWHTLWKEPENRHTNALNRMTDTCENITFPQLCWRAVTIKRPLLIIDRAVYGNFWNDVTLSYATPFFRAKLIDPDE